MAWAAGAGGVPEEQMTGRKRLGSRRQIGLTMTRRRRTHPTRGVCASSPTARGNGDRMTHQLGLRRWATGALVLAALSGCTGTSADPSTSRSSSAFPSSSAPSVAPSTPTPKSPREEAAADAASVLRRYFKVLDAVRQNRSTHISRLGSVMTSLELATERRVVLDERQQHRHQVGPTLVADLNVRSVHMARGSTSKAIPTVRIDVCWDVSRADLVDDHGQSVVSSARPDRGWTRYSVANFHWSTNPSDGWRVASGRDLKKAPCAAS